MKVLSTKHPGLWFICEQCSALIVDVKDNEIYEDSYVYCPICKNKQKLEYNKSYNGIVINQKNLAENAKES